MLIGQPGDETPDQVPLNFPAGRRKADDEGAPRRGVRRSLGGTGSSHVLSRYCRPWVRDGLRRHRLVRKMGEFHSEDHSSRIPILALVNGQGRISRPVLMS